VPVKGFQGTSLLDFPGRIASLVFFSGCNLSCPFCHNPDLLVDADRLSDYPLPELIEDLRRRSNFIDGVVVTGGEPTLAPELVPLLQQVRELGLLIKVDTNGLAPQVMERLIHDGLVDYVALDLKTSPERYGELHNRPVGLARLGLSLQLLKTGGVEYELRTTCVPGFVYEADMHRIGQRIKGAKHWVLQQFVPGYALSEKYRELEPHPVERIRQLAAIAAEYAEVVSLRGV
jgi:pyruvate formate lyase activating enzyme